MYNCDTGNARDVRIFFILTVMQSITSKDAGEPELPRRVLIGSPFFVHPITTSK